MKVTAISALGVSVTYHNIVGMSLERTSVGDRTPGDLVLIVAGDTKVKRIRRWDWDRFVVTKDLEQEKA